MAKGEGRKAGAKKAASTGRKPSHGRSLKRKPVARGVNCSRLRKFCRAFPGVTEDVKWGADLVSSVGGKMFVVFTGGDDEVPQVPFAFKCSDEDFDRLVEKKGIIPAPYAARFGWVSVREAGALSQKEAELLVAEAYRLVKEKLPRKVRENIG